MILKILTYDESGDKCIGTEFIEAETINWIDGEKVIGDTKTQGIWLHVRDKAGNPSFERFIARTNSKLLRICVVSDKGEAIEDCWMDEK